MKIKALLYCTKANPTLYNVLGKFITTKYMGKDFKQDGLTHPELNGKIVAECDFEVEEIEYDWYPCNIVPKWDHYYTYYRTNKIEPKEFYEKSCLNWEQLNSYLNDYDSQSFKDGYAIHIKNLKERVMELSNVYKYDNSYDNMFGWIFEDKEKYNPLIKAPQNMMRVWLFENGEWIMYILISIRPEWLYKILNGEKTIEVRKKVLKEMLKKD